MKSMRFFFLSGLLSIFILGAFMSSLPGLSGHVGEALMVSAVSAATVDLYLKRKLTHEFAGDIAKYLIGYTLPTEIRDRINSLMRTDLIRRNYVLSLRLLPLGTGSAEFN